MRRRLVPVLILIALLPFLPASAGATGGSGPPAARLLVGVVPFYAPEKIHQLYTPFVEYLSRVTGLPWELKVYPDHDSFVREVGAGKVAVAFLGPVPAARVGRRIRIQPLAAAVGPDGRPSYRSVVVTVDPAVKSLRDLDGKDFGYFKGSTAAHLVPLSLLDRAGANLSSIRLVPFPGQDGLVEALLAGTVPAAGIKESLFLKFRSSGLRMVAVSGNLPTFAFYATSSLPAAAGRKIARALLDFSPGTKERDRLAAASWDDEVKYGFVRPPKGFEASVEEMGTLYEKYAR
jgi:ABC-type phosphate/phosphonate transport system substrate-binding protein